MGASAANGDVCSIIHGSVVPPGASSASMAVCTQGQGQPTCPSPEHQPHSSGRREPRFDFCASLVDRMAAAAAAQPGHAHSCPTSSWDRIQPGGGQGGSGHANWVARQGTGPTWTCLPPAIPWEARHTCTQLLPRPLTGPPPHTPPAAASRANQAPIKPPARSSSLKMGGVVWVGWKGHNQPT